MLNENIYYYSNRRIVDPQFSSQYLFMRYLVIGLKMNAIL